MIEFIEKSSPSESYDYAVITGKATSQDAVKFGELRETKTLILNAARGWDGDLEMAASVFSGLPVKSLEVFALPGVNVSPIHMFCKVEELRLRGLAVGDLYLDEFPLLKKYGLGTEIKGKYKVKIHWGKCLNLEKIGGLASRLPLISTMAEFPKLNSLSVVLPKWEPEELEPLVGLTSLEVGNWSQLSSLQQLPQKRILQKLHITNAKNLHDYSALSEMLQLKSLMFENCPEFPSISLVVNSKLLEELFLVGIKIIDGDLSPLLSMPFLKKVAFKQQKHLSPSPTELEYALTSYNFQKQ